MGRIARLNRRKNLKDISLKSTSRPKHGLQNLRATKRKSLPSVTNNMRLSTNGSCLSMNSKTIEKLNSAIRVNCDTSLIIQKEVMDLLQSSSNQSCSALSMATALLKSQACLDNHSFNHEQTNSKTMATRTQRTGSISSKLHSIFSRKTETEEMKSRYELMGAFARIEKNPSSRDKIVSSWKEAKIVLEEELSFPSTIVPSEVNNSDQDFASLQKQPLSSTAEKHANMLESDLKNVQEGFSALWLSSTKWKQIKSYPDQKRLLETAKKGDTTEDAEDLVTSIERESIEKADLYFNARIPNAEALYKHVQRRDDRITELEERMKAKEAEERASSLMQTLNDDDRQIVEDAIHGHGGDDQIIAQVGADSVRRASMRTLKPGMWLNDEIIHYFYLMLAKRDEGLWKNDPSLKRSHFFKSFFITKLLNEGSAICDGKYEYRNVKRWSKKVPGKDIFNLDKILFPINMGNMHWICAAIFMKKKRIEIFDSMGSSGNRYLNALFKYIQDEHMDKKKTPLPDADAWELVPTQGDTPRQRNGHDCGVFTCMFADFLSKNTALVFNQDHINQCRERIALSIMKGEAIM